MRLLSHLFGRLPTYGPEAYDPREPTKAWTAQWSRVANRFRGRSRWVIVRFYREEGLRPSYETLVARRPQGVSDGYSPIKSFRGRFARMRADLLWLRRMGWMPA